MKIRTFATALVLSLALSPTMTAAAAGKTITVFGQDDVNVDRAAIQEALDNVVKNGTVELVGIFQLDGGELFVRNSHVTVRGRANDDDGDGQVNEDWADGVDNDGDGAIDEDDWDAVLKGILDGSGRPYDGGDPLLALNRGIAVIGLDNVQVTDLKFTGLVRGVAFGTHSFQPGYLCDEMIEIGAVRNSSAARNLFDNNLRGGQIYGESHQVRFRDNIVIKEGTGAAFLLVGEKSFCVAKDGSNSSIPIGRPSRTMIDRNRVYDRFDATASIAIFSADQTTVLNNELERVRTGVHISDSPKTLVQQNRVVDASRRGVQLVEDVDTAGNPITDSIGTKIQNNFFANAGRWSVALFDFVTGVKASNNDSINPGRGDYFLQDTSFENRIILKDGQTAVDDGTDNEILGG